jgi:hypothetical protein
MGDHEVKAATAFFDIVNGFLKSMPWRYGFGTTRIAKAVRDHASACERTGCKVRDVQDYISTNNLAEI